MLRPCPRPEHDGLAAGLRLVRQSGRWRRLLSSTTPLATARSKARRRPATTRPIRSHLSGRARRFPTPRPVASSTTARATSGTRTVNSATPTTASKGDCARSSSRHTMSGGRYRYIYDASGLRVAKATFTGTFPAEAAVCPCWRCRGQAITLDRPVSAQPGRRAGDGVGTRLQAVGCTSNVWAGSHLERNLRHQGSAASNWPMSAGHGGACKPTIWALWRSTSRACRFGDNLNTVIPTGAPSTAETMPRSTTSPAKNGIQNQVTTTLRGEVLQQRGGAVPVARTGAPRKNLCRTPKLDDPQTLNLYSIRLE